MDLLWASPLLSRKSGERHTSAAIFEPCCNIQHIRHFLGQRATVQSKWRSNPIKIVQPMEVLPNNPTKDSEGPPATRSLRLGSGAVHPLHPCREDPATLAVHLNKAP